MIHKQYLIADTSGYVFSPAVPKLAENQEALYRYKHAKDVRFGENEAFRTEPAPGNCTLFFDSSPRRSHRAPLY